MRESSGGGIGLLGAVFLVFLILKLTGVIAWSWLWVFAPLWIPVLIALVGFVLFLGITAIIAAVSSR